MPDLQSQLDRLRRLDAICDRFESDWRAGVRPSIDEVLVDIAESDQSFFRDALVELVKELSAGSVAETMREVSTDRVELPSHAVGRAQTDSSSIAIPERIGRFEIRKRLGSGAFGQVFLAFDPQLHREIAIKIPLPNLGADERQRFVREARSAANINHPNVCQILEVGQIDSEPYIVMALVEGNSLAEILANRSQPLEQTQAAIIIRKVAIALEAAHRKGIIHRDLKPANIMYDAARKDIVVMDFGLARATEFSDACGTRSGIVMGTPAYMSPEQARGDSKMVGPASDIYSLAVVFYELLTRTRPFVGTATEVIGQILHVDPRSPSAIVPAVDRQLERICMRAMDKRTSHRYRAMSELANDLQRWLKQHGPPEENGQDPSRCALDLETHPRRFRRRRVGVLVGVLLLGFLAAFTGILFFTQTKQSKVTLELTEIDLKAPDQAYWLDGRSLTAEQLGAPLELPAGEHELVVKRGDETIKHMRMKVTTGRHPTIRYQDVTPDQRIALPEPTKPESQPVHWRYLIQSADELVPGVSVPDLSSGKTVRFHQGRLELSGEGTWFRPRYSGKNYIVRMRVMSFKGTNMILWTRDEEKKAGYGAFFHTESPYRDLPTTGIGKKSSGENWRDIAITLQRVSDRLPIEFAFAVDGSELSLYLNGIRVLRHYDHEHSEGGVRIALTGNSQVALENLEVCDLDSSLHPDDLFPQTQLDPLRPYLEREFLTEERMKSNPVRDGDFELAAPKRSWSLDAWRNDHNSYTTVVADTPVRKQTRVLMIRNPINDSVGLYQHVAVKPNRRYLLSAWIRTENIRYMERDRQGAHLHVRGGYVLRSELPATTSDWTYTSVIFESGSRSSVEIQLRLGTFAGTVTGTAWFDDVCLVELPGE